VLSFHWAWEATASKNIIDTCPEQIILLTY
jgi:hypothetical protein